MIATIFIGTISWQGVLLAQLPGGLARVAIRGRVFQGRLAAPLPRGAVRAAVT